MITYQRESLEIIVKPGAIDVAIKHFLGRNDGEHCIQEEHKRSNLLFFK